MKRFALLSVLVVAFLGFAGVALAQEASVFGDGVLVRAFLVPCTGDSCGPDPTYSAYLEVRDKNGNIFQDVSDFIVTGVLGTDTPQVDENPFFIHDKDLVTNDISISYDIQTKTIYVFCSDGTPANPHLHVMTYDIHENRAIDGVCGLSSGPATAFTSKPTTDLCSEGTPSPSVPTGSGPWTWSCSGNGISGAQDAHCQAETKGVCGPSNGGIFPSVPTTNLCNLGTASTPTGSGPWTWHCYGTGTSNSTADCSATKQQSTSTTDLIVALFKSTSGGTNGLGFPATVTVQNIGTGSAGQFTVKIYLSRGGPEVGQLLQNGTKTVSGLAAGASTILSFSGLTFTGLNLHTVYSLIAVVDANGQVGETNENNNTKSRDFEVM